MEKSMFKKMTFILLSFLLFNTVMAAEFMTADEIKALFTDQSWDIHNVVKDKNLEGYATANGEHHIYIPWKDKVSHRKWWLDGDMHCTSHPKRGDNCKKMKPMGEGVYHGISDGEHTHTLKNFKKGPRSWFN